jgi:HEAT repeat protein
MASNDVRLRAAAIETRLAVENLSKTSDTVTRLIHEAESDHAIRRRNAFLLGCLANRDVQADRIREWLLTWRYEADDAGCLGTVEGLALVGSDETLDDLKQIIQQDLSSDVRSAAIHAIARTGMFTEQQRRRTLPSLIELAEAAIDENTRKALFEALREITAQSIGDDAAAWREWYTAHAGSS